VRDPLTWLVAAVVAVPIVAAGVVAHGRPDVLASDMALINLRIGDVFGPDTPLLGPFSRFDWNHPGPLMFWLLAPVWRVLGSNAGAMWAAGAVANLVAAVGLVVMARRLGGRALLVVTGLATLVLLIGTGTLVADPWNPYLAMLPFAVFLLAAAAVATGDLVAVPVAVGVGSLLVQTHVGYALLVGVVGVWSAAWLIIGLWRRRQGSEAPGWRRLGIIGAVTVVVALAAWSGPLVEQFGNDPGNLTLVFEYFTTSDEPTVGSAEALSALGRQLSPVGPWLGGAEEVPGSAALMEPAPWWWALPALGLLAASMVVAWRRQWREPLLVGGTVAVGVAAALVATSQITGFAFVYLLRFWWPLAMLCWVSVVWVATLAIPTTWASAMRVHSRAVASAVAVVGAVLMIGATVATTAEPAELPGAAAVGAVADGMAAGLTPGGTYLVEPVGWSLFGELFGIVDALESRGFTPVADARFTIHFAPNRTEGVEGAPTTFDGTILVATSRATTDLLGTPGLVALASWDPLTPNERAEVEALWNEVRATLGAAGRDDLAAQVGDVPLETLLITGGAEDVGLDPDTRARIDELEGRGIPVTIFLAPAPDGGARGEERRR
jgi:hypothetical protein